MARRNDDAVASLYELLSIPSQYSVKSLEIDPQFDALRDRPTYAALLEKHRNE